jgi:asparagine N-glycosylation enzyme membrane subunit Stt3
MTGTKSNKNNTSKEENETAPVTVSSSPMEAVYVSLLSPVASAIYIICFLNLLYRACVEAYNIRLYAINEYGRVIHEFDPYFNYRAAEVGKKGVEQNKVEC